MNIIKTFTGIKTISAVLFGLMMALAAIADSRYELKGEPQLDRLYEKLSEYEIKKQFAKGERIKMYQALIVITKNHINQIKGE